MTERSIPASIHGRYLVHPPATAATAAPLFVGFHGYGEDAEAQLARLAAIPGSDQWLTVSIQALHQFYGRRDNRVVASWMTRQHREAAIADNIAYVASCLDAVSREWPAQPVVLFAGFSQGVAIAFRAAAHSPRTVAGVIAVGGDVPPELSPVTLASVSSVLLARGDSDPLYSADQFAADRRRLENASVAVHNLSYKGGHEWSPEVTLTASRFLRDSPPLNSALTSEIKKSPSPFQSLTPPLPFQPRIRLPL